jgi:hypothetical protein
VTTNNTSKPPLQQRRYPARQQYPADAQQSQQWLRDDAGETGEIDDRKERRRQRMRMQRREHDE